MTRPRRWLLVGALLGLVGIIGGFTGWWLDDSPPPRFSFTITARPKTRVLGFTADGGSVLAQDDQTTTRWDVTTGRPTRTPIKATDEFCSYSSDHQRFAGYSVIDRAVVWGDTATATIRGRFTQPLEGRTWIPYLGWVNDDQSVRLVTCDPNRKPLVLKFFTWEIASGVETRRSLALPWENESNPEDFSHIGRFWLRFNPTRDALQLWDATTAQAFGGPLQLAKVQSGPGATRYTVAALTHDNRTLVVGRDDGQVDFWDVATQRLRRTVRIFPRDIHIGSLSLSPDDQTLAADGTTFHKDTWLNQIKAEFSPRTTDYSSSEPYPDLVLIDLRTDQPLARYPATGFWGFSPDGRLFLTSDRVDHYSVHDIP